MHRIFLLSPAHAGGKRARILTNDQATFPLAERLRREGLSIGEAFAFLSGLYFRGKLAYAERFAAPPPRRPGVLVITANRGLLPAQTVVGADDLLSFGAVDIRAEDVRYREPLERDVRRFVTGPATEVVLLGSVATGKYVDVLLDLLGDRLLFPVDFVGRGDMSRGALLLRAARDGRELEYQPVVGSTRRGPRPRRIGS